MLGSLGGGFLPPVILEIGANITQLRAGIAQAKGQVASLEAQGVSSARRFGQAFRMGTMIAGAAVVGFAAIAIREAMKAEQAMMQLTQSIEALGQDVDTVVPQVQRLGEAMIQLGFDDDEAYKAFSRLNTAVKDSAAAMSLMGLTADFARKKNMSLEQAARTIALATTGSARAFREFGITLDTSIKDPTERVNKALLELQKRLGGTAEAFSQTAAGQMAVFREEVNATVEELGVALLPAFKMVIAGLRSFAQWARKNADVLKVILVGAIGAVTVALIGMAIANVAAFWKLYLGIAIIMALVAALAYAWNNFEWFRKGIIGWGTSVLSVFEAMLPAIKFFWESVLWGIDKLLGGFAFLARAVGDDDLANTFDGWGDSVRGFSKTIDSNYKMIRGTISNMKSWLAKDANKMRIGFDVQGFLKGKFDEFQGLSELGSFEGLKGDGTADAGASASKKSGLKDNLDRFLARIEKYADRFNYLQEVVEGNIPAMKKLSEAAVAQAQKFLAKAVAMEKAARGTDRHEKALRRLAAAMRLATEAQAYNNDVNKQAEEAALATARALDTMVNSYSRTNSYLAAMNRVSGFNERFGFVEVPVVIDGQVLFRVTQKASLVNNRRNTANNLSVSGSVI